MKQIFSLGLAVLVSFNSCASTKVKEVTPAKADIQTENTIVNNTKYWQQHADYTMEIDVDVKNFQYKGKQTLIYTNNSPDVLDKVFYHLYFNAFQPGSEMDARLQNIVDPDGRMANNIGTKENPVFESRIAKLKPNEIGYIKVSSLKQNGVDVAHSVEGTVLEVKLNSPIKPGEKVTFDMVFDAQVPKQIRRSGRQNKEGVELSMTQWYPKLAEYDFEGWHAHPYIAREFHSVWGNFDVTINIDKNYVVGGTGILQNPNQVGYGYETGTVNRPKGDKLKWHFKGDNIHDFTWAADPDFVHDTLVMDNGITLNFLYQKTLAPEYLENWKKLPAKTAELMTFFSENVGPYPYKQYSVIQGGDGGMEYAMCTLITGERKFGSLVGVTAHELAHSWFQFLMATNESKHEWMDEGFTTYISNLAMNEIMSKTKKENPNDGSYQGYYYLVKSGKELPQTTHADRYHTNQSYGISAYSKGAVFLTQLGYVIGEDNLKKTLKRYYKDWSFKHPTPNDFIRCAEKESGLELDWYLNDWTRTTNTIDYAVKSVDGKNITLERIGLMPMPLDVAVIYTDGTTEMFYIPLTLMRGEKASTAIQKADWGWGFPTYTFEANKTVQSVEIDPKGLMADINKTNNKN